jgi:L-threonylcarbamoyladenylate synthase
VVELVAASDDEINQAAEMIRSGGIVAFPTETVYGLGANAFDANAVARIFEVKERPLFDPLIVHLADASQVDQVAYIGLDNPLVNRLVEHFWPGPLTLVLPKHPDIPSIVTSGLDTIAVRVPGHNVAQNFLRAAGVPVAAPSANSFGSLSPTRAQHVKDDLDELVDLIVDGGPTTWGLESTIVAVHEDQLQVLRLGAVTVEALEEVARQSVQIAGMNAGDKITTPGQLPRHYSPRTPIHMINRGESLELLPLDKCCYLAFNAPPVNETVTVEVLSPTADLREAASRLFDVLHRIDASGAEMIVAEWMPERGLGRSINDRLRRASATRS